MPFLCLKQAEQSHGFITWLKAKILRRTLTNPGMIPFQPSPIPTSTSKQSSYLVVTLDAA